MASPSFRVQQLSCPLLPPQASGTRFKFPQSCGCQQASQTKLQFNLAISHRTQEDWVLPLGRRGGPTPRLASPRLQHVAHGRTCMKPVLSVMAWAHNTVVWSPLASRGLLPDHVSEDTTFGFTLAHTVEIFS